MSSPVVGNPPYQDGDLIPSTVRLREVLALLRVLAGTRGRAVVQWWGGGFAYELRVVRRSRVRYAIDHDEHVEHGDLAAARLRDALTSGEP
jgi:hypothetical protein